jgi:hypothetical protein
VRDLSQWESLPLRTPVSRKHEYTRRNLNNEEMTTHQTVKEIVTAGLKCPPDVGPAMTMANMIPRANAKPIWKKLLYAVTGGSAVVEFNTKPATDARPGKLNNQSGLSLVLFTSLSSPIYLNTTDNACLHIKNHTRRFADAFAQPSWPPSLKF